MAAKNYVWKERPIKYDGCFTSGVAVTKVDEDGTSDAISCSLKIDNFGYFLIYQEKLKDAICIDIGHISYVKDGCLPRALAKFSEGESENIETTSAHFSYGTCMTDRTQVTVRFNLQVLKQKFVDSLSKLLYSFEFLNPSIDLLLHKQYIRCISSLGPLGVISVRTVAQCLNATRYEVTVKEGIESHLPGFVLNEIVPEDFHFEHFYKVYSYICPRKDIDEQFFALFGKMISCISAERLKVFLNEKQRDSSLNEILFPNFTLAKASDLITKFETNSALKNKNMMSISGFLNYLLSDENLIMKAQTLTLHQDMTQPFNHYFINSSHNTYLTGRQVYGKSSVDVYRQVLVSGCRCIELDICDGPDGPIITHVRAMCTNVLFADVIKAIAETAFLTSPYPVILSFENHCSLLQQRTMAEICIKVFGPMLLASPLDSHPLEPGVELPSPEHLKYKIIIKNKKLRPKENSTSLDETTSFEQDDTTSMETGETNASSGVNRLSMIAESNRSLIVAGSPSSRMTREAVNEELRVLEETVIKTIEQYDIETTNNSGENDNSGGGDKNKRDSHATWKRSSNSSISSTNSDVSAPVVRHASSQKVDRLLSTLVNYVKPQPFRGFDYADSADEHFVCSSFSEIDGMNQCRSNPIRFVSYNKRQLSRMYPKGTRVDSTNYLPQVFWNVGSQLVALNLQTTDLAYQLNQQKFEVNKRCGYILKPEKYRKVDAKVDPLTESPIDGIIPRNVEVEVISGQFLSTKKCSTYVQVDLYGLPADTKRKKRTLCAEPCLMNTVYPKNLFKFNKVVFPELALLRFAVFDDADRQLAHRIMPLDALNTGYQHVALRSEAGLPLPLTTLFVRFTFKIYVHERYEDVVEELFDPIKYKLLAEQRASRMSKKLDEMISAEDVIQRNPKIAKVLGDDTVEELNSTWSRRRNAYDVRKITEIVDGAHNELLSEKTTEQQLSPFEEELTDLKSFNDLKDEKYEVLCKRHAREEETLFQSYAKDMEKHERTHSLEIEKLQANYDKCIATEIKTFEKFSKRILTEDHRAELNKRHQNKLRLFKIDKLDKVTLLLAKQKGFCRMLLEKQMVREKEMKEVNLRKQVNLLRKNLKDYQQEQLKRLSQIENSESLELQKKQAKESLQSSRVFLQETQTKSKAESARLKREQDKKRIEDFHRHREKLMAQQKTRRTKLTDKFKTEESNFENEVTLMYLEKDVEDDR